MPTTNYVWDEDNILYETDGSKTVTAEYTNSPQQYGDLISEHRGGTTFTHYYDAQGSTLALTDETGAVGDTFAYTAWGEQLTSDPTTPTPFRWIGQIGYYWDAEQSLYFVRARCYDPLSAIWVSIDPLRFGRPEYLYANASPTLYRDPSGLITPLGGYGKYCGPFECAFAADCAKNSTRPTKGPAPIDGLDAACYVHDCCLGTALEFANPFQQLACNVPLCCAALFADCSKSPSFIECTTYRGVVLASPFCTIGAGPPGAWIALCYLI